MNKKRPSCRPANETNTWHAPRDSGRAGIERDDTGWWRFCSRIAQANVQNPHEEVFLSWFNKVPAMMIPDIFLLWCSPFRCSDGGRRVSGTNNERHCSRARRRSSRALTPTDTFLFKIAGLVKVRFCIHPVGADYVHASKSAACDGSSSFVRQRACGPFPVPDCSPTLCRSCEYLLSDLFVFGVGARLSRAAVPPPKTSVGGMVPCPSPGELWNSSSLRLRHVPATCFEVDMVASPEVDSPDMVNVERATTPSGLVLWKNRHQPCHSCSTPTLAGRAHKKMRRVSRRPEPCLACHAFVSQQMAAAVIAVSAILLPGAHFFYNARKQTSALNAVASWGGGGGGGGGGASGSGLATRNLRSSTSPSRLGEKEQDTGRGSGQNTGRTWHPSLSMSRRRRKFGGGGDGNGGNGGVTPQADFQAIRSLRDGGPKNGREGIEGGKGLLSRRFLDVVHNAAGFFGRHHLVDDSMIQASTVADAAVEAAGAVAAAAGPK